MKKLMILPLLFLVLTLSAFTGIVTTSETYHVDSNEKITFDSNVLFDKEKIENNMKIYVDGTLEIEDGWATNGNLSIDFFVDDTHAFIEMYDGTNSIFVTMTYSVNEIEIDNQTNNNAFITFDFDTNVSYDISTENKMESKFDWNNTYANFWVLQGTSDYFSHDYDGYVYLYLPFDPNLVHDFSGLTERSKIEFRNVYNQTVFSINFEDIRETETPNGVYLIPLDPPNKNTDNITHVYIELMLGFETEQITQGMGSIMEKMNNGSKLYTLNEYAETEGDFDSIYLEGFNDGVDSVNLDTDDAFAWVRSITNLFNMIFGITILQYNGFPLTIGVIVAIPIIVKTATFVIGLGRGRG